MSRRRGTNSPLKTFVWLLVIGGLGYVAYAHRDQLQGLTKTDTTPPAQQVEMLSEVILAEWGENSCFDGLRTALLWRKNEQRWRLDILVPETCESEARHMCTVIAHTLHRRSGRPASVFAYDYTDRLLAKVVL